MAVMQKQTMRHTDLVLSEVSELPWFCESQLNDPHNASRDKRSFMRKLKLKEATDGIKIHNIAISNNNSLILDIELVHCNACT